MHHERIPEAQPEQAAYLKGAAGPGGAPGSRLVETHVSVLVFLGDRVYKLRKALQFGFVDFREREAREADCIAEVALNRRLAPDVYLGVADVVVEGRPVDHMVVMRRLPDERQMSALAAAGRPLGGCLEEVAATMAGFHRQAPRSEEIAAGSRLGAQREAWRANGAEIAPFVGPLLDRAQDEEILARAGRWLAGRGGLLDKRIAEGRVCDGHGDLLAGDVFCLDDGVRILDCLEFSPALRAGDGMADMAFLAMDLEHLGRPDDAAHLLARYRALSGDTAPPSLVAYYCGARAYIRAKVACLRAAQGDEPAAREARRLHRLALELLRRATVTLVVVGGLPGTGKSTLARSLAASLDGSSPGAPPKRPPESQGTEGSWTVLSSDQVRAELFGRAGPRPEIGGGRYSPRASAVVYATLLQRAQDLLEGGRSVVLDATWLDARHRRAARVLAARTASRLVEISCRAPAPISRSRLSARLARGEGLSEATPEVYDALASSTGPWPTAVEVPTGGAPSDALAHGLGAVQDPLPRAGSRGGGVAEPGGS